VTNLTEGEKVLFSYWIDDSDGNRAILKYWAEHLPNGMWVTLTAVEESNLKIPEMKLDATTTSHIT